jgi:hypothetical protein
VWGTVRFGTAIELQKNGPMPYVARACGRFGL